MTAPAGPAGEPPLDALPPDAPATVEDVRATRRWAWVAFAWAIAASAIAVIALIQAGKDNSNDTTTQTTTNPGVTAQQFGNFQKQVNDRLDAFSHRLSGNASQADVQKLGKQLAQVQSDLSSAKGDVSKQGDSITQLQSDVKDLQKRVSDLESKQQNQQNQTGSGTTTTP